MWQIFVNHVLFPTLFFMYIRQSPTLFTATFQRNPLLSSVGGNKKSGKGIGFVILAPLGELYQQQMRMRTYVWYVVLFVYKWSSILNHSKKKTHLNPHDSQRNNIFNGFRFFYWWWKVIWCESNKSNIYFLFYEM